MGDVEGPEVTVALVVRNSALTTPRALTSILAQSFPKCRIQLVLIDGESTDGTLAVLENFKRDWGQRYGEVMVVSNRGLTLASGWNLALNMARAPYIVRFDAHSWLGDDYLKVGVDFHRLNHSIVGGVGGWLTHEGVGIFGGALSTFYASRLGGGAADYRRRPASVRRTDTAVFAVYRTDLVRIAGGFNEQLTRNQDLDMHRRLAEVGGHLYTHPEMTAYYQVRSTLGRFISKSWLDGYWVALSQGIRPRHLAPSAFVSVLILLVGGSIFIGTPWRELLIILLAVYAVSIAGSVVRSVGLGRALLCSTIFFLGHLAYGLGTLRGLIYKAMGSLQK